MIQSLNDLHPPVLHDSETPWRHAVDAPVCDALVVADRDGEAAVVSAHHPDLVGEGGELENIHGTQSTHDTAGIEIHRGREAARSCSSG